MSAFVGTTKVTETELKELLRQLATPKTYYFQRWIDRVSGFTNRLNESLAPEGQMFNADMELRWQQKGDRYRVLLLSNAGERPNFQPLGDTWKVKTHNAFVYPKTETRFPKSIKSDRVNINQLYFLDAKTSTVHFVALTITN